MPDKAVHRVVIVGGGAGGLELATRLGDKLGRAGRARVTLVDKSPTHLWKPLLHQVAAGTSGVLENELEFLAQAHWHCFRFVLGAVDGLDRAAQRLSIAPMADERGREISARRDIGYDTLVICVGSESNDFGTPGAREHAISLDHQDDAVKFHRRLINAFIRAHSQAGPVEPSQLDIAIIGAGATGVELAAELHYSTRQLASYGYENISPDDVQLTVIEAAPRILPQLPERLSEASQRQLEKLGVQVFTGDPVVRVSEAGVDTKSGRHIPAELVVWAAGIKAPAFLSQLDGLEVNRFNQLVVTPTLQTTRDENIFAFGDCAACPWVGKDGKLVPPRAQAAHQQASLLVRSIENRLEHRQLSEYTYRDFGSLVSLGEYSTVGSLMGRLTGGSILIEGWFARIMYVSLYKLHLLALHGFGKVVLDTLARLIARRTQPQIKLH